MVIESPIELVCGGALQEDEQYHQEQQSEFSKKHCADWEVDVAEKIRLTKMRADVSAFQTALESRRSEEFAAIKVRYPVVKVWEVRVHQESLKP